MPIPDTTNTNSKASWQQPPGRGIREMPSSFRTLKKKLLHNYHADLVNRLPCHSNNTPSEAYREVEYNTIRHTELHKKPSTGYFVLYEVTSHGNPSQD